MDAFEMLARLSQHVHLDHKRKFVPSSNFIFLDFHSGLAPGTPLLL
jgi:hypothetical protein